MSLPDIISAYFDAWNRHDADAIAATFVEGGTYEDPTTSGALTGAAIGEYAKALWEAFPDVAFTCSDECASKDRIAVQWQMTGINQGPFRGLPPTGRGISVPGADFFQISGGKIASVRGHFDSRAIPEQLGLQVIVQPHTVGPFTFGTSTRVHSGSKAKPEAFSITMLEIEAKDTDEIRLQARQLATEMLKMPGLISVLLVVSGNRRITISAWEHAKDIHAVMKNSTHQANVVQLFKKHGLSTAGNFSSWVAAKQSTLWMRCEDCGEMVDSIASMGSCSCGSRLPEPAAYF